MFRTSALNIDHQQNQLFFKLAVTMAATIGISQIFFAYTNLISPIDAARLVGGLSVFIQRCVIFILFTSSKKVQQLHKEKFCTTGASS